MNQPSRITTASLALAVVLSARGAAQDPNWNHGADHAARSALRKLSVIERRLNEWGTFSISDFLLLPQKDQFVLSLTNTTTETYIERARNTRSGSGFATDVQRFQGQFEATVDTVPGINTGLPAVAPPTLVPTANTVTVTNILLTNGTVVTVTNSVSSSGAPGAGSGGGTAPGSFGIAPTAIPAELVDPASSRISERQALEQGISDKVYERLLSQLTQPIDLPNGQRVVFGIVQLSCQPGWRTANDYIADLHVDVGYARLNQACRGEGRDLKTPAANGSTSNVCECGKCPPGNLSAITNNELLGSGVSGSMTSNSHLKSQAPGRVVSDAKGWTTSPSASPSVYAVLPLTDSLQFDLQSRRRRELDLAASLAGTFAAKGLSGAAKMMARYVRERDFALESASMIPVATTYTDGSSFGFRIYPRPQGITQPGDAYSGAGSVLQPVSFPALVGIIVDTQEEGSGVDWTHFRIDTHTRWIPVQGRPGPFKKAAQWFAPNYRGRNIRDQLNLDELGELGGLYGEAVRELSKGDVANQFHQPLVALAFRTLEAHRNALFGHTRYARLPAADTKRSEPEAKPMKIAAMSPGTILNTNQPVVFTLRLENVVAATNDIPTVWIGGVQATNLHHKLVDKAMLVIVSVKLPEGRGTASVPAAVAIRDQLGMSEFQVVFPGKAPAEKKEDPKGLKVTSGAKLKLDGQVPVEVEIRPQ
jgi:hypothetical protein